MKIQSVGNLSVDSRWETSASASAITACCLPSAAAQPLGYCCCQHGARGTEQRGCNIFRRGYCSPLSHTDTEASAGRWRQKGLECAKQPNQKVRRTPYTSLLSPSLVLRPKNMTHTCEIFFFSFQMSGSLGGGALSRNRSGNKQGFFGRRRGVSADGW